ncbi:MAG TPA: hypothetical protein VFA47_11765 [Candidatus Manganitrophaceae bacterium]|nr:hypothetical protein [Candidatus Manganitrophaceae bacterium]
MDTKIFVKVGLLLILIGIPGFLSFAFFLAEEVSMIISRMGRHHPS